MSYPKSQDLDGSSSTWDDQYVLVSYGYIDADNIPLSSGNTPTENHRPTYSSRFLLTSSTEGVNLQLHLDNPNFKFVRYYEDTDHNDKYDHSLDDVITIPEGNDVHTYFYVVPKTTLPSGSSLDARSCHVYVTTSGAGVPAVKLTYANGLPGGTADSSEIWFYYTSPDSYDTTGVIKQ